jgi:RNA polymerase sigma factor (sigma-70 family)
MNNTETLEEKFSRNAAWSEEFKHGYKNGYNAAKSHWKSEMKKALDAKDRERVNLLRVYPYNLIPLINGEDDESDIRAWEEDNKVYYSPRLIEEVMTQHLTERENKVLQMRYEWGMSLEEVGSELGVTKERIRQIEARAIRKMRMRKLDIMCAPAIDYRKELSDNEVLRNQVNYLQSELDRIRGISTLQKEESDKKRSVMETSIDELNLSVRAYNCCKRAGINTLGDLSMKTLGDMCHVRNLGRHSLQEIEKKMAEYGLRFKPEETEDE